MKKENTPKKIYYFSSTHWDREWYKTVDEFRFKLVPVIEKIIQVLENDENFRMFTLDGQTRVVEDYLVVGKKNEKRLKDLIQENKIKVGPWYTMPDEFLTSCESLIRNLYKGHTLSKEYGVEALKNGYVCDIFGHVANLPQILNGFGIKSALISRGTNDSELPCFFYWKSPDNSEVLTFKTPETCGYGSFFFDVLSTFGPDYENHLDDIFNYATSYVKDELRRTSLPFVILMDGMDHETIHPFMPQILAKLEEYFSCPVVQIPLDEVFEDIDKYINLSTNNTKNTIPEVKGELARLGKANAMHIKLIPHTLSSRYDLKKANDECQTLLEKIAEPISTILAMDKKSTKQEFLDYAYDILLENHAHDSICGCSIDAVHKEMLTRFDKVKHTANEYIKYFLIDEYNRVKIDYSVENKKTVVKVFNPLPYEYEGTIFFDICFTPDYPVRELPFVKFEQRNGFRIFNINGEEIKYNLVSGSRKKRASNYFGDQYKYFDIHTVCLEAKLAPTSFTSFEIRPDSNPYRILERFSISETAADNGLIKFSIHPDGSICIEDKENKKTYDNLHTFTDCGEIGDGWFHIRPIQDELVSSIGCPVSISKIFDGYAACQFLVKYDMLVPKHAVKEFDFSYRTGEETLRIESVFTIERNSKTIKIHTTVKNNALDHKLCLKLPVEARDNYFVDQCGLILNRETGIDITTYDWKETDIPERAFESMVFTRNNNGGLLFISKGGLHEVANLGGDASSLNITLFRAFSATVKTNGEHDGELQGDLDFEYSLTPISNESDAKLINIKNAYVSEKPFFTVETKTLENTPPAFIFTSDNCIYNTALLQDDGIIIRAINYSKEPENGKIEFRKKPKNAYLVDFLGNILNNLTISKNTVHFEADGYKIVNIKVVF